MLPVKQLHAKGVPQRVIDLLRSCLAIEPNDRPPSAAELTQQLQVCRDRPATNSSIRRLAVPLIACVVIASAVSAIVLLRGKIPPDQKAEASARAVEKSIAVLPFENLSDDPQNSYFAAGVQDEILSNLAKIADLKVISRTSASLYKNDNPRNAREIGEQLGVAHLLEGNVQRIGDRVRVNAQLIDARSDTHIWAQIYDRNVADLFAIQTDIAQSIAAQLQAKISPTERAAMVHPPTADLMANALYAQALNPDPNMPDYLAGLQAVRLLEEAVTRDPRFVLAYCALAHAHLHLYFGYDHTPARRDRANVAIENAARFQPDAGEVHLARAQYFYHGFRDYDRARAELALARATLPNDPKVLIWTAGLDGRLGKWAEAIRSWERAVEVDPRNVEILVDAGDIYERLRRYPEAALMYERAVAVAPHNYFGRTRRASLPFNTRADIRPLREELDAILAENPSVAPAIADILFYCAIIERDSAAVSRVLTVIPPEGNFPWPREWSVAFAARIFNDPAAARTSFTAARVILDKRVREQPDNAQAWSLLARVDAALGRKKEAIEEGRRGCELVPFSKDALFGINPIRSLAWTYAWAGEKDLALEQLEFLQREGGIHYGELKLNPEWDSLRGEPRFEKIVAALAPQEDIGR